MKFSLTSSVAVFGTVLALAACGARRAGEPIGQSTTRDIKTGEGSSEPQLASSIPRQLRRLSAREYNNVIRDLLGDDSRPADQFIPDAYPNGYDNGSAGLAIQSDQVFAYQRAAEAIAAHAVASGMDRLLGGCQVADGGGVEECESAFLHTFAPRAFRRPLSATETGRLDDVFRVGAEAGGFSLGIQTALELILQSPQFLYREELGPIDALVESGRQVSLTDYEVASELSFLLTGSLPDDDLWTAVQAGRLATADDRRREASRIIASGAARETLRSFMHQWLGTARLADLSKDPRFYPTFDASLAASMTQELDRFYDASLFSGDASLRALFTSSQSFVDPLLAQLYGIDQSGEGFQPVALDPDQRKGILTRAGFLAAHAAADSSGPIARGVFVLQAILCSPPAPPPPDVPAALPASAPTAQLLTTRQRFDEHVSRPVCAGCHRMIDGIGFGFEEFDGIGAHRSTENGQPVDSSGTIIGAGEIDGDYRGAGELAVRLSGSRKLVDCYLRQAYRFAMGRVEPPSGDGDALAWLRQDFSPDARLVDALLTMVTDPRFAARSFE